MKKLKVLVAALLSVTVVLGTTVPSQAAMSSDVNIEIKQTTMDGVSVTVPTMIPIVFNADGTNTLPTNWTIENLSTIAGIYISHIEMDANDSGWTLLGQSENVKDVIAGLKKIKFYVGDESDLKLVEPLEGTESEKGRAIFGRDVFQIKSGETRVLSFDVERGAFRQNEASAKAFGMELFFDFR